MDIIRALTDTQLKGDLPHIKTGDTVKVSAKVVEGNRERIQVFEGIVRSPDTRAYSGDVVTVVAGRDHHHESVRNQVPSPL